MEYPIRCFTCGKVIGHMFESYKSKCASGTEKQKALDELGIKRYCCRRMFVTSAYLSDEVINYTPMK